ncbi:MAG: M28 family peptidase [Clostridia bacterium]|nr:M28 family peptidase [Clostridia bacterium]
MKARESVKNYPSALREMTNYSVRGIKKICTEVGARPSGSEQEFEAQKHMMAELEQCCDSVQVEEFKTRPNAITFSLIAFFVLAIAMSVFMFFDLMVPFFVLLAINLVILFTTVARKSIFAPFFPKKTSHNIIGIKKPEDYAANRRIIFSAYCDSTEKRNSEKAPIGANRNLSGCFAALSVVKFLQRQELKLENTEIWIVLTGSRYVESAGARAFASAHKFDDMETIFIGLDTLYDPDGISVSSADESVYGLIQTAIETTGLDYSVAEIKHDAAETAKKGIKSACIGANIKSTLAAKSDNADALNPKAIEACVDIALETAFLFDTKGLIQ